MKARLLVCRFGTCVDIDDLSLFHSPSAFSTSQPRKSDETEGRDPYVLAAAGVGSQSAPNRHTKSQITRVDHAERDF